MYRIFPGPYGRIANDSNAWASVMFARDEPDDIDGSPCSIGREKRSGKWSVRMSRVFVRNTGRPNFISFSVNAKKVFWPNSKTCSNSFCFFNVISYKKLNNYFRTIKWTIEQKVCFSWFLCFFFFKNIVWSIVFISYVFSRSKRFVLQPVARYSVNKHNLLNIFQVSWKKSLKTSKTILYNITEGFSLKKKKNWEPLPYIHALRSLTTSSKAESSSVFVGSRNDRILLLHVKIVCAFLKLVCTKN